MLKLGSLFDGIGGWQIAAKRAGIHPVWSSEVEKFPLEVTKMRFPETLQLGDINGLDGAKIPPVDIITMGSPCQDLSIAGKRMGLCGERSGLFVRAIELIRQMHAATDGKYPVFVVWENVPGAFSSNKGLDFREVLQQFTETEIPIPESGKWAQSGMVRSRKCEVAWRTLDAQYWGVPQRRRRIFIVADYAGGERAGKILFEPESVQGNIETCTEKGEAVAAEVAPGIGHASALGFDSDTSHIVVAEDKTPTMRSSTHVGVLDMTHASDVIRENKDIMPTLTARAGMGGNQLPLTYSFVNDYKYVRKLTPLECERIQGLPDNWTLISDKSCSDTARYKAIGNGMAQPCADFVMRQISKYGKE